MERYRIHKHNGMPCPAILGLTASPIMRSRIDGIEKIEEILDAVCKTPTIHREELMSVVKRPALLPVIVPDPGQGAIPSRSMASLASAFQNLDIRQDPYILHLQTEKTERNLYKLQKALGKRDTYVIKQVQSFYLRSAELNRQLGLWATEYFIHRGIARFLSSTAAEVAWLETLEMTEKRYLANVLRQVETEPPQPFGEAAMSIASTKFTTLVQQLQSAPVNTRCIVFVRETATVAILTHMLSATSSISSRFQVGAMIGTSTYAKRRRDLGELEELKDNQGIEGFRTGKLNLLIATSVAEEGIDVPACNLVICFDPPANVKSFIQRRGRARMGNSRIILLLNGSSDQHETWLDLEAEMKRCYENDTRVAGELSALEERDINLHLAPLRISSTGAQLDFDQAKPHLEHFCQKLTSKQYIDHRPYYIPEFDHDDLDDPPKITAVVHLPPSLPQALRCVRGVRYWYSEKNAFKDAAFQAFKAVYAAGLVNDNLMPLTDDLLQGVETRSSMLKVDPPWTPWPEIAQLWGSSSNRVQRELLLKDGDRVIARFEASLPCYFPKLSSFSIFWDADNTWIVETSELSNDVQAHALKDDQSAALLDLAYGHRQWPVEDAAHILHLQSNENIGFRQHVGQQSIQEGVLDPNFVIRNTSGRPYLFIERLPSKPAKELVKRVENYALTAPEDVPWLALGKWPRRQDLLHPVLQQQQQQQPDGRYPYALPESYCMLDTIDRTKAYFGGIIPSLIHMLEIHLIAEELRRTVLAEVGYSDISLVLTAISSRAANEATDYERLEFLGDSILKILATVSVMVQQPYYPEGYLSAMKDRIVSNSRLCRASVDKGLDKFILTKAFTGAKWRPLYVKNFPSNRNAATSRREMSTKTLADVVESLVGAAFVDGGIPKALTCLQLFLPEVQWYDLTDAQGILSSQRDMIQQSRPEYETLEKLFGYTFQNKAFLIDSLTHASWSLSSSTDVCMERLEFLGDPILDNIVVSCLWAHEPQLTNNQMHLLRTACVNAHLLGFLVMEWHATQETTEISPTDLTTIVTQKPVPYWKYMRHGSSHISSVQEAAEARHAAEREAILDTMAHGAEYPWAQLAHLDIPKFYSDMFESLIGAVWVDSGSLETCKQIVERVGILPYLRRMLADNVEVKHPKNKLGELAGREDKKVRYESEARVEGGVKDLVCRVFVGEELIVEVHDGVNPEEVMTKAAEEAYRLLVSQAGDSKDVAMTE